MLVKAHFSPRRLRRLGWAGFWKLPEVVMAYRLYNELHGEPLPDMLEKMSAGSSRPSRNPFELVKAVDWFLHPLYMGDRCMPRTLILFRMLVRRGFKPKAIFGVSKTKADLEGHAWIELEGEPLVEHEDPRGRYAETYRFEVPHRTGKRVAS